MTNAEAVEQLIDTLQHIAAFNGLELWIDDETQSYVLAPIGAGRFPGSERAD